MKFQIFDGGREIKDLDLSGAYMFGTDGIAIRRAEIRFQNGLIECVKTNLETAGLALLWTVKGFGTVILPTTCLTEREKPYNLNLELARAKLMQIINKREDWAFFNPNGAEDLANDAQRLFIDALKNSSDSQKAAEFANQSLQKAMMLSERLATKQADMLLDLKLKNRSISKSMLGCDINLQLMLQAEYIEKFAELFPFAMIPINWANVEAQKGIYDWSQIDKCIEILIKHKIPFGAGPLLCFIQEYLPAWMLSEKYAFEKIREMAYNFVLKVVSRYPGIRLWKVISGLNAGNFFGFNFEQVLEMTRSVTMAVKAVNEKASKIIEITKPWGEYYATEQATIPPLVYIDMVVQSGINFEAFGIQMKFGRNAGKMMRDLMHVSALLDKLAILAKPIYITGVEVPNHFNERNEYLGEIEGDEEKQASWLDRFCRVGISKPLIESIIFANLADCESNTIKYSGLINKDMKPKKAYDNLKKLQKALCKGQA